MKVPEAWERIFYINTAGKLVIISITPISVSFELSVEQYVSMWLYEWSDVITLNYTTHEEEMYAL